MNACPDDAEIFKLVKRQHSSWKFYFVNKNQFDHFCEVVSTTCRFHVAEIMQPSSDTQVDTLRANGLIVYREHWFHNDYEWKVTFKDDLGETVFAELQQWILQTLVDENDANRYKIRSTKHTLIFYLKHEDDVLMTKLTHASDIKHITRAIIAEPVIYTKNNNNKGNNNASSTLSQTP